MFVSRCGNEALDDNQGSGRRAGLDQVADDYPTPELLAILAEQHQRLMSLLDLDGLRQVALWRLEGYTNVGPVRVSPR